MRAPQAARPRPGSGTLFRSFFDEARAAAARPLVRAGRAPARAATSTCCAGASPRPTPSSPPGTARASATDSLALAPRLRIVGALRRRGEGPLRAAALRPPHDHERARARWRSYVAELAVAFAAATRARASTRIARRCAAPSNARLRAHPPSTALGDETLAADRRLLGFGRIGRELARDAAAVRRRLLVHDPYVAPAASGATAPRPSPGRAAARRRDVPGHRRGPHRRDARPARPPRPRPPAGRRDRRERGARRRSWTSTRSPREVRRGPPALRPRRDRPGAAAAAAPPAAACGARSSRPTSAPASARCGRRWPTSCSTTSSASSRGGAPRTA